MPTTALTVIHKHIRREMFDFSMRLFRAGPCEIPAIKPAFEELTALLHAHARQEETRFEQVLRDSDPGAAATLLEDHRRLDVELERLAAAARALDAASPHSVEALLQFHLDWNRYLGSYLGHLDAEERILFVSIAEHMPVGTIAKSAIAQGAEGKKFLDRLWSVTTPSERAVIEQAHGSVCAQASAA